ncbi:hypothetical protein Trydic_g14059 [Trypoxylus dichotomus]
MLQHKSVKPKNKSDGYQPISLLPRLRKILKRVIQKRLLSLVEEKFIIPGFQCGFRREHSTTQQLLRVSDNITSNMDKSTPTAAIMLDIEKAFNNVWHDDLIHKMRLHRIPATLANTIQHYLRGRTFSVKIEEYISTARKMQAGVLPCSMLGLLLFNIYTSDIPQSDCPIRRRHHYLLQPEANETAAR